MCPWNVSFAAELKEPAFAARPGFDSPDARALATPLLTMSVVEYTAAFRGSAMKRAKLAGLQRNAAVVLENLG